MFLDLKTILLTEYGLSGRRSIARAEGALERLEEVFGHDRALAITPTRILSYIEARISSGVRPATVQYEVAILRRAFNLAVKLGKLSQRPYMPTLKIENTRTGFFEAAEFQELQKHLPAYLKGFAEFLYLTGWRFGEAARLTWSEVDFAAGIVRIETSKNFEARTFPIAALPRLEAVLREQRDWTTAFERRSGRIVPLVFHRDGEMFTDLRDPWKKACAAIGLPHRLMHDFRRTAVRNLERAGVPRSVAMKLTGHKTESVYRRYAIVSEADLKEGVAKLARLHASQVVPEVPTVVPISRRNARPARSRPRTAQALGS
jgi:integrase